MSAPEKASSRPLAGPDLLIENVSIITPELVLPEASVLLRGGRIAEVGRLRPPPGVRRLNAAGLQLWPGFVDLHSDAIEKEVRPRPGGSFPLEIALTELDKRLAACGVTTMYHCLCFGESQTNELRTAACASRIARTLHDLAPRLTVRNRVHIRFEVVDLASVPTLCELIAEGAADLFSFMDHTPGQGQFMDLAHFKTYYSQAEHLTGDQAERLAETRLRDRQQIGDEHIRQLAALCRARGVPLASHDDDTEAKVKWLHGLGVTISEFPVREEAARTARRLNQAVLMGSPNVLRGASLTGNLSGQEAIQAGLCNLIGSDYSPMSLLHAVWAVKERGLHSLPESVALATRNPAQAVGLTDLGEIRPGALADLILIEPGAVPRIVRTFVNGREVFAAPMVQVAEAEEPFPAKNWQRIEPAEAPGK